MISWIFSRLLTYPALMQVVYSTSMPARPPPPPPAPPPAPPPVLGLRRRRKTRRLCRQTTRMVLRSSRRSGPTAMLRHLQSWPWRRCLRRAGRRAHAIQDFQSSFRSFPLLANVKFHSSPLPSSARWAIRYTHIEIICLQNCVNVGIDCDIIGEIMDVIICDIIGL